MSLSRSALLDAENSRKTFRRLAHRRDVKRKHELRQVVWAFIYHRRLGPIVWHISFAVTPASVFLFVVVLLLLRGRKSEKYVHLNWRRSLLLTHAARSRSFYKRCHVFIAQSVSADGFVSSLPQLATIELVYLLQSERVKEECEIELATWSELKETGRE